MPGGCEVHHCNRLRDLFQMFSTSGIHIYTNVQHLQLLVYRITQHPAFDLFNGLYTWEMSKQVREDRNFVLSLKPSVAW